jgi:hypothetical protein
MTITPAVTPNASGANLASTDIHEHHIARNLAITVAASALILAGLAGLQYLRTQPATAPATTAQAVSLEAYVPGGSVYAQQVPTVAIPELTAFAPGGSVYSQQVPTAIAPLTVTVPNAAIRAMETDAGTVAANAAGLAEFAPGGSVYAQQVPAAPSITMPMQAQRAMAEDLN